MLESTITQLPDPSGFASDPLTELVRNGARKLIEQAIEAELTALLAAHAEAEADAARQQEKIEARTAEAEATGKRKRGRKPKPAEAVADEDAKANVTDPDSRIMKSRKGYLQGYNA